MKKGGSANSAPGNLLADYSAMLRVRLFEQKLEELFAAGLLGGTAHLCIGQEACAVGVVSAARDDDWLVSHHRGHGHLLVRGLDPARLFAELLGRAGGYCGGRGGSQHVCALDLHVLGTNGITGGGLPIAAGAALAVQRGGGDGAVLSFFGDGAVAQGTFHETLNLAALWRLPVLFVCENNGYSMSMQAEKSSPVPIASRGAAYAMPAATADGMDVDLVRAAAASLLTGIRAGRGPALLELRTYRFCGHSRNDALVYRSRQEEEEWRRRDPLAVQSAKLLAQGTAAAELHCLAAAEKQAMDAAAAAALDMPYAPAATALEGVYRQPPGNGSVPHA